jgi:hypothetical protein
MRKALKLQFLVAFACLLGPSRAGADFVSYINPAKINDKTATGNQGYTGSLGMDFKTLDPIVITQLGAFDSGLKGFAGLTDKQSITVAIFDTSTGKEISPELTFTKASPGTLVDGSRFKTLETPIKVAFGVELTVVAWGFTNAQQNGNFYLSPYDGKGNPPWTTNGNSTTTGWISFEGTGRYGATAGAFPKNVDAHKPGVPNPYAAGTFMWTEGLPEPSSFVLAATGALSLLVVYGWKKKRKAFAVVRKQ